MGNQTTKINDTKLEYVKDIQQKYLGDAKIFQTIDKKFDIL